MAVFTAALVVLAVFIVYILLYSLNPLYVNILLAMVFVWAYPNLSDRQAGYYLILLILVFIFGFINRFYEVDQERKGSLFGARFLGFQWVFVNVLVGGAVLVIMAFLQGRSTGAILGVATLSVAAPSSVSSTLGPSIVGLLGLIENRFLFSLVDILRVFWLEITGVLAPVGVLLAVVSPVAVVVLASLFFAVLHVTAYSFVAINLIFAFIVAAIWIVSYLALRNSIVADVSHLLWNAFTRLGKELKIVTDSGSGFHIAGGLS